MVLVAYYDLELHQMDVKISFLNGNIEQDVFMVQPVGSIEEGNEHMVYKLKKSIYGLKQASRHGILSSMILLCPLDLRKTLLISAYI